MEGIILQDPKNVATQFRNRVIVRKIDGDTIKTMEWCKENIANRYQYDRTVFRDLDGEYVTLYSFAKKEDAMAFKLMVL